MHRAVVASAIVFFTGCYHQTRAHLTAPGQLELVDADWQRQPGDRVSFRSKDGHWSPSVPLSTLVFGGGSICTQTDRPIRDFALFVRIAHVRREDLPGLLAGIENPGELEIEDDGSLEIYISPADAITWTGSPHHVETDQSARYEVELQLRRERLRLRWDQVVALFRVKRAWVGWSHAEVADIKIERGDQRTNLLVLLPLLPLAAIAAPVVVAAGVASKHDYTPARHRGATSLSTRQGAGWYPELCDPFAHYAPLQVRQRPTRRS